jgi:hypothetical protein
VTPKACFSIYRSENADPMGYGVYLTRFIRQGAALFVKNYQMFGRRLPPKVLNRHRNGIALREVIVLIAILLALLTLGSPYLLQLRAKSRRAACERNMLLVSFALSEYEQQMGGFPGYRQRQLSDDEMSRNVGWVFSTLPYLRPSSTINTTPWAHVFELYGAAGEDDMKGDDPATRIGMLLCPAAPGIGEMPPAACHFVANGGLPDADMDGRVATDALPDWPANGVFLDATRAGSPKIGISYIQQRDGTEMTLLLSENTAAGPWSNGKERELVFLWDNARWDGGAGRVSAFNEGFADTENSLATARASSFHVGGANVVFVSGASRVLSDSIDQDVFVAMMATENAALRTPGETSPLPPPFGPGTAEPEPSIKSE